MDLDGVVLSWSVKYNAGWGKLTDVLLINDTGLTVLARAGGVSSNSFLKSLLDS